MQAAEDFLDLPRNDQRGQMKHHADSHAGADIGRTGGQISPTFMERIHQMRFDKVIDTADLFPCGLQVQPAVHDLNTQMIFFVNHQAVSFA